MCVEKVFTIASIASPSGSATPDRIIALVASPWSPASRDAFAGRLDSLELMPGAIERGAGKVVHRGIDHHEGRTVVAAALGADGAGAGTASAPVASTVVGAGVTVAGAGESETFLASMASMVS